MTMLFAHKSGEYSGDIKKKSGRTAPGIMEQEDEWILSVCSNSFSETARFVTWFSAIVTI